jgi:carboxylate-amine ligase
MRYSFDERLLDLAKGELVPYPQLIEELLEIVRPDAEALGCLAEVQHARQIVARGTSAHRQEVIFAQARARGASEREALRAVVDWLIEETAAHLQLPPAGDRAVMS